MHTALFTHSQSHSKPQSHPKAPRPLLLPLPAAATHGMVRAEVCGREIEPPTHNVTGEGALSFRDRRSSGAMQTPQRGKLAVRTAVGQGTSPEDHAVPLVSPSFRQGLLHL